MNNFIDYIANNTPVMGIIISAFFILLCYLRYKREKSKVNWVSSKGKIVKHLTQLSGSSSSNKKFIGYLQYQYIINDTEYLGNSQPEHWKSKSWASKNKVQEQMEKHYPIDSELDIFYNPNNTKDSDLTLSDNSGPVVIMMGILSIICLACIIAIIVS